MSFARGNLIKTVVMICMSVSLTACKADITGDDSMLSTVLGKLQDRAVFFGHQSVGLNILDGLRETSKRLGAAEPEIIETRSPPAQRVPGVYHAMIGQNERPLEKIADYESIMRGGMAEVVDVSFMKFCYVDFNEKTDTESLFEAYRSVMSGLERDYPNVTFVYLTVPLRAESLKDRVKNILGRSTDSREANLNRERFNRLVRAEYAGKNPFFDLALAEASSRNGNVIARRFSGETYYLLRREYTEDFGHLNGEGRSRVVAAMLSAFSGFLD